MCEKLTVEEFMKEYERTKKPCIFFRREKTIMIEFAKAYVEKIKNNSCCLNQTENVL